MNMYLLIEIRYTILKLCYENCIKMKSVCLKLKIQEITLKGNFLQIMFHGAIL